MKLTNCHVFVISAGAVTVRPIYHVRTSNNNNNTVISIALFTDGPGALTTSDVYALRNSSVLRRRLKRPLSLI